MLNVSDVNNKNNCTFGWHYPEHSAIVETAIKKAGKKLNSAVKIMINSAQKPDLDENFLYCQSHFYYPDKKLFKWVRSYLDITGTQNAKVQYEKHCLQMDKALKHQDIEKAFDEAGRTAHYLADMCQPNHIEKGSILQKAKDKVMHNQFEMQVFDNQEILLLNSRKLNCFDDVDNLDDLFNRVVSETSKLDKPSENNRAEWNVIAQQGIELAVNATEKFIEIISKGLRF